MATLLLSAAGAAFGGSIGGGILGVSSVAIGKAVGATIGAAIDRKIMGAGADAVEIGRRDMLRLQGSREGAPIPRVWGQMRVAGQMIWSSGFTETVTSGGGKGAPSRPATRTYSYSVSVALALCEGEITRIGRVWIDGALFDQSLLNLRVYRGTEDQLPDPLIAAAVPDGAAPAYRGTAYVVIEDLDLAQFGNRIPQFGFEVVRKASPSAAMPVSDPFADVRGVALMPGSGEYALATEPVSFAVDKGVTQISNVNNDLGIPDAAASISMLREELPGCGAASLVVSWFGSDLRCADCRIEPKVEQLALDGTEMPWEVSGLPRANASPVSQVEGRPGFGGTPADASVVQSIHALRAAGQAVMFYPFILMDIRAGNGLPDPWGGAEQPPVPWRGRITASVAPGRPGTPDKTASAGAELAAFFGTCQPGDFALDGERVIYSGPEEWSYRRFILHYAQLCRAAGGVDAFCIGSEMRSLTQLRDGPGSFPAVAALRTLAADVRAILGPETKIGYAADWSEYFGYQPGDGSGDVFYHLDPLWADPAIDFVGIDNYMPISDWRDGDDHADASHGSIYDLGYLRANIAGGEGYDWYYATPEAREYQIRTPITDGGYEQPWVFRYKDLVNWWSRPHWNRPGGVRDAQATAWEPESKPIWFTELGCPAVDKGTNQPNVFLDPQSSENALPYHSTGGQDRFIQMRYLEAVLGYWNDPDHNPASRIYSGRMVEMSRAFVWAWDLRPWPEFPRRLSVWSDGANHVRGHWISGRTQLVPLAALVAEICSRAGVNAVDVSDLHGDVQGYVVGDIESARQSLQPLMLAYGFDCFERSGTLVFRNRDGRVRGRLEVETLAVAEDGGLGYAVSREPAAEAPDRVQVSFLHPEKDFQPGAAEAQGPGVEARHTERSDLPLALSQREGEAVAARWLTEAHLGRDRLTLSLPRSRMDVGAGDVLELDLSGRAVRFRIDRVEDTASRVVEAVRVEPGVYRTQPIVPELVVRDTDGAGGAPHAIVMDLPLLTGSEDPTAAHVAATVSPWAGPLAVLSAPQDHDYRAVGEIGRSAVTGELLTDLPRALADLWSGQAVDVRLVSGELESREAGAVLAGANAAAIRHGPAEWEVLQFRKAELVGDGIYRLTGLLRGQAGTDGVMPDLWPAGSEFVLLDGAPVQIGVPEAALGLARHYRVGPVDRPVDDRRYAHEIATVRGVGLRPYAPAHLCAGPGPNGAVVLSWIRRTRVRGDSWELAAAPLGEVREAYEVRIRSSGGQLLRTEEVASAGFTYTAAMQAADGAPANVIFEVAQISDSYGPGAPARMDYNG